MNKETSSRVSSIAAEVLRTGPLNPNGTSNAAPLFNKLLEHAKTLAGSCMSQDETPGQQPENMMVGIPRIYPTSDGTPGFIDRLLTEREALQEKHEKLLLFLDGGATGASEMQRHLLSLQLCAMTNYGDILDRRLEDLDFPTGDLEPFCGPGINNVGMENTDGE